MWSLATQLSKIDSMLHWDSIKGLSEQTHNRVSISLICRIKSPNVFIVLFISESCLEGNVMTPFSAILHSGYTNIDKSMVRAVVRSTEPLPPRNLSNWSFDRTPECAAFYMRLQCSFQCHPEWNPVDSPSDLRRWDAASAACILECGYSDLL